MIKKRHSLTSTEIMISLHPSRPTQSTKAQSRENSMPQCWEYPKSNNVINVTSAISTLACWLKNASTSSSFTLYSNGDAAIVLMSTCSITSSGFRSSVALPTLFPIKYGKVCKHLIQNTVQWGSKGHVFFIQQTTQLGIPNDH